MEATPEPQTEPNLEKEQPPKETSSYAERNNAAAAATDEYFPSQFEAAPGLEALSTAAAASNYDYMQPVCIFCSARILDPSSRLYTKYLCQAI